MFSNRSFLPLRASLVFLFVLGLSSLPASTNYTPSNGQNAAGNGQEHQDEQADPCSHLDQRGNANGIERRCPKGSSGGVARGDFNGDGIADLAIGSPGEDIGTVDSAGSVTVIYGSVNGLTLTATSTVPAPTLLHQNVLAVNDIAEAGDRFGAALASGNFDGDQFSDLAVGVPGENSSAGAVQIFRGSATGLLPINDRILDFVTVGLARENSASFGAALVWGDFDGDTIGDLAVGAPNSDLTSLGFNINQAGMIVVLFGLQNFGLTGARFQIVRMGSPTASPEQFGGEADPTDRFGGVLAAGDFTGDQTDELVVGVPSDFFQGGASVFVINGVFAVGLTNSGVTILRGLGAGLDLSDFGGQFFGASSFGSALAVGDFNGDGFRDLAVGIPERSLANSFGSFIPSREEVGSVQVFFNGVIGPGTARGLTTQGTMFIQQGRSGILDGPRSFDHFGAALAAGRFNDDGFTDLAIGVPDENVEPAEGGGAVHVVYGSATGPSATAGPGNQFFHQESAGIPGTSETADRFGASLTAWNFGRDFLFVPGPCVGCFHRANLADLVIGAPGESLTNASGVDTANAGRVLVIYGTPSSGITTSVAESFGPQEFSQAITGVPSEGGVEPNDSFGASLY